MTFFQNTNEEFGYTGLFTSDSVETAVEEMEDSFKIWATDAFHKSENVILSEDEWVANRIQYLKEEYALQLEEVEV